MRDFLEKAKSATQTIATLDSKTKNRVLHQMAQELFDNSSFDYKRE